MGFLTNINDEITVTATLTEYGRRKLSQGLSPGITKFSLGDDGIDYLQLWNNNNPFGEAFDGVAIERMAIQEPVPASATGYRYHLFTSDTPIDFLYTVDTGIDSILQTGVNNYGTFYIKPKISPTPQNIGYTPWYKLTIAPGIGILAGNYMNVNGVFSQNLSNPYSPGFDATPNGYIAGEYFTVDITYLPSTAITYLVNVHAVLGGLNIRMATGVIQLYPAKQDAPPAVIS